MSWWLATASRRNDFSSVILDSRHLSFLELQKILASHAPSR
jgi:hypothetical protein